MRKKGLLSAIILAVLLLAVTGCGKNEGRVLRIGTTQVYTTVLTSIAVEKGYLAEELPEGATFTFSKTASGPDARDALIAKQIDLCDQATMTYMMSMENNLPMSIICGAGSTPIYLYSANDDIKNLSDFTSSSRIAITNKGTTLHGAFLGTCNDKLGDALALDNNLVPIPAADALASLAASSEFDGAIFSFPNKIKADKLDKLTLLEDMSTAIVNYGDDAVMVVRDDYLNENRDIIDAYIRALERAKQFVESNPNEAAEILSKIYGVEPEYIVEAFIAMPPNYKVRNYDKLGQLLYESGVLTKAPTKFEDLNNYENIPRE